MPSEFCVLKARCLEVPTQEWCCGMIHGLNQDLNDGASKLNFLTLLIPGCRQTAMKTVGVAHSLPSIYSLRGPQSSDACSHAPSFPTKASPPEMSQKWAKPESLTFFLSSLLSYLVAWKLHVGIDTLS